MCVPSWSSVYVNRLAARILEKTTGLSFDAKNPATIALGRMGGMKAYKARAQKLTSSQRKKFSSKAALAGWKTQRHIYHYPTS